MTIRNLPESTIREVRSQILAGEPYQCLSLGGGVQSSTLWLMNMHGLITPRAEFAVFADTGWERQGTYNYLDYLDRVAAERGFPPVMRVAKGNIREDILAKAHHYSHMPLYTDSGTKRGGMLNRQCTGHYKIDVIKKELRALFGMKQRVMWIGFSLDEISRMNNSRFPKYIKPRYPLLERNMTRADCLAWLEENLHPSPVKSSCVGCPYRTDAEWNELKEKFPAEFEDAGRFDEEVRDKHLNRPKRESNQGRLFEVDEPTFKLYLHKSREALSEIEFAEKQKTTEARGERTLQLALEQEECQGGCFL